MILQIVLLKQIFIGHLPQKQKDYKKRYRTLASTYLTFSPDGTELLVNLGGEQIYLFDVNRQRKAEKFDISMVLSQNGVVKGLESLTYTIFHKNKYLSQPNKESCDIDDNFSQDL